MRIVLFGVSTRHANELVETARRLGWEIQAAVRNMPEVAVPDGIPAVIGLEGLDAGLLALPFAVPQTDPAQRRQTIAAARAAGFTRELTMIDPTAVVASSAVFGDGCYVGAGSVIGAAARFGAGCLVNRSCSIAHHVSFGDYACTGPGLAVAGSCRIEDGAFLGAGAVLAPEVVVGEEAVVGAGAVVIRDVAPGSVVVGNPARVLERTAGP